MALENDFQNNIQEQVLAAQRAKSESERNRILMQAAQSIAKAVSEKKGVSVDNLDVLTAAIMNQFKKHLTPISKGTEKMANEMGGIKDQIKSLSEVNASGVPRWVSDAIIRYVDFLESSKEKDRKMVTNNSQAIVDKIVAEIDKTIKIKIPEPKVTVEPAPVEFDLTPVITAISGIREAIPESKDVSFESIINALEPLERLRLNGKKNPLSVRLSNGEGWINLVREMKGLLKNINAGQQEVVAFGGGPREVSIDPLTDVKEGAYTAIADGRQTVTTAGTAVQLSATSTKCKKIVITAETDNTNPVVVGGSTVVAALATRRGQPLFPAQTGIFHVDNLNKLYIDAITNGEGVSYAYYN